MTGVVSNNDAVILGLPAGTLTAKVQMQIDKLTADAQEAQTKFENDRAMAEWKYNNITKQLEQEKLNRQNDQQKFLLEKQNDPQKFTGQEKQKDREIKIQINTADNQASADRQAVSIANRKPTTVKPPTVKPTAYKTHPAWGGAVAEANKKDPATYKMLVDNPDNYIKIFGYDGYKELLRIAKPANTSFADTVAKAIADSLATYKK
jgi:K+-sensing histidine kinase KdpD